MKVQQDTQVQRVEKKRTFSVENYTARFWIAQVAFRASSESRIILNKKNDTNMTLVIKFSLLQRTHPLHDTLHMLFRPKCHPRIPKKNIPTTVACDKKMIYPWVILHPCHFVEHGDKLFSCGRAIGLSDVVSANGAIFTVRELMRNSIVEWYVAKNTLQRERCRLVLGGMQ